MIGTVSRTGISGFFIGNTAETILSQLQCSLLASFPEAIIRKIQFSAGHQAEFADKQSVNQ